MALNKSVRTIRTAILLGTAALAGLIIGAGRHAHAGAPPASAGCKAIGNGWWNGTAAPGQTINNIGDFNTGDQISVTYSGGGKSQGNVSYNNSLQFVGISTGWSNIPPNAGGQARNPADVGDAGSPTGNGTAPPGVRLDQLFSLYAQGNMQLTVLTNSVSTQSVTRTVTCTPTPISYAAVANVSPLWGQPAGGTSVAITGTAFTGATTVAFGNTNATFTVNSDTSITATAPPGTGAVDVTVTTAAGPSPTSVLDQFTYAAAAPLIPTITVVSNNPGLAGGGFSPSIITGTNFTGNVSVAFGAASATSVSVDSATQITAIAPPGAGTVDVTVITSGGMSATTAADKISYAADTHDLWPRGQFCNCSSILWRDNSGNVAGWIVNGSSASGIFYGAVSPEWSIIGQRDFDGDGTVDILWRDSSGNLVIWFVSPQRITPLYVANVSTNWTVVGTGNLKGDGTVHGDILWQGNTGDVAIWFMNGSTVTSTASLGTVPTNWSIVGDDSFGNIFWRDTAGDVAIWQVNAGQVVAAAGIGNVPSNWKIAGLGDFNGDGVTDILWRDSNTGTVVIWFLSSAMAVQSTATVGVVGTTWSIAQTGDYNGDGKSDILWIDNTGNIATWFMNGGQVASTASLGNVGTSWQVQSANSE